MFSFKKKEKLDETLLVPKHIGIIMDGNGRWAKKRMQPRVFGHKAGMEALQGDGRAGLDSLCLFNGKLDATRKRSVLHYEFAG